MALDDLCKKCHLYVRTGALNPNIPPAGDKKPDVYLVANCPTKEQDKKASYFQGKNWRTIRTTIKKLGLEDSKIRYYAPVNCTAIDYEFEAKEFGRNELQMCSSRLLKDIEETRPKRIVAMGKNAIEALFPKALPSSRNLYLTRGATIPYTLQDGTKIPLTVTQPLEDVFQQSILKDPWVRDLYKGATVDTIPTINLSPKITYCSNVDELKEFFAKLKHEAVVSFDVETTTLHPMDHATKEARLYTVAFAFQDNTVYTFPVYKKYWPPVLEKAIYEGLTAWIEKPSDQIRIGHNTKFDLKWLVCKIAAVFKDEPAESIRVSGNYEDTSLLSWIFDERPGASNLKYSAFRYLGVDAWSVDVKDVTKVPLKQLLLYNALDAFYTLKLWEVLSAKVKGSEKFNYLYTELLLPASLSFMGVEIRGTPVDVDLIKNLTESYTKRLPEIVKAIRQITKNPAINPGSAKQLQEYFIQTCGYELPKKIATGYSVGKDTLAFLAEEHNDEIAKMVLEYRNKQKILSTYITGMDKNIYKDGKIHASYNLTSTVTGRTSSSDPNMQNFPKREDKEVRRIVIAPEGHVLACFDYGQIEARLFAIASADKNFCAALEKDYDIHLDNAKRLFGENEALAMRAPVKNATFAMLYGSSPWTAAKSAGTDEASMVALKKSIFEEFSRLKTWQKGVENREKKSGYIDSLFGKRRRSPMSYNELLNHTMQSTASDMTVYSMIHLSKKFLVAIMIHDDLSFYLPDDENLEKNIEYISRAMVCLPWIPLAKSDLTLAWTPLQVECEVGNNWCDLEPVLKVNSMELGYTNMEKSLQEAKKIHKELQQVGYTS